MSVKDTTDLNRRSWALDIPSEVEYLLNNPKLKKDREVKVLVERFGLSGSKPKTLEEIGSELGITRERVRQIEKNSLAKVIEFANNDLRGQEVIGILKDVIINAGGAINLKNLYSIVLGFEDTKTSLKHMVYFLSSLNKELIRIDETSEIRAGFVINTIDKKTLNETIKLAVDILDKTKKPIEERDFLNLIEIKEVGLNDSQVVAILTLSKKIIKTDTGHLGLIHWRDINPKSIRDKTYYILKKHNKPLHFTEISKHIDTLSGEEKKVTKQAVHNELIRDERFVLIGRGIYALSEWGFSSGVVEEVIEEILNNASRPMHKDEIIEEVLKRRMVKETTILLNLQKDKFKRTARATYTLSNRRG
jgi:DNA-directed RNA polymerase delta subunit